MNDDLLSCKRQAVAMANSEQPPLEKNGRKKGYIKIMREIWDAWIHKSKSARPGSKD